MLDKKETDFEYERHLRLRKQFNDATSHVFQNGSEVAALGRDLVACIARIDRSIQEGGPLPTAWKLALRPRCATCNKILEDGRTGGSCRGCQ